MFETDDESTTVKALRERGDKHAAEVAELKAQLEALQGELRVTKATQVIEKRGLPNTVADIIPRDVDPGEWLDKYAGLFKGATEVAAPAEQAGSAIDEQTQAALAAVQAVEAGGSPDAAVGYQRDIEALAALGGKATSFADVVAQINSGAYKKQ